MLHCQLPSRRRVLTISTCKMVSLTSGKRQQKLYKKKLGPSTQLGVLRNHFLGFRGRHDAGFFSPFSRVPAVCFWYGAPIYQRENWSVLESSPSILTDLLDTFAKRQIDHCGKL